jgi:hypothetical protein
MNPPPFLEISDDILDIFKAAAMKYVTEDSKAKPQIKEIVVSMLLGEQWVECSVVRDIGFGDGFEDALFNLLPTSREIAYKEEHRDRYCWNARARKSLFKYLNEPTPHS